MILSFDDFNLKVLLYYIPQPFCPRVGAGGAVDDGYPTFGYRDPLGSMPGGGAGTQQQHQQSSAPPPGMPMYAVHSDGYSTVPVQPTYAVNGGDAYGQQQQQQQGVLNHLPPHTHGVQGGGPDVGGAITGVGDQQQQQLVAPHMSPVMGSPQQPPMAAPQKVYMSAQGTYVVADGGRSNGVSSAGSAGGAGGGVGSGNAAAGMQPMVVYQQGGNAQGQQAPGGGDQAAAGSQMFLPMSQAGYGYVPQMNNHLQPGGGVPVYQMAGTALDGGVQPSAGRSNGVASGSGGVGGAGTGGGGGGGGGDSTGGNGRVSPGSPSLTSPQPGPPPPQSFQVQH